MATSAGEVEVKLSLDASSLKSGLDQSKEDLNSFDSALKTVGETILAAFTFAKIAEFFQQSIEAYAASQLAVVKLTATLEAHGIASQELIAHLQDQSAALEALTGIQQVNLTSTQAMLATYGIQGPLLDQATTAAANFAVRTGSLETATNLLAKAFDGNVTMLKRYGLTVDQTVSPQKQFEELLEKINTQFGPVATAQAGSFQGSLTAMGNAFTHLKEAVGDLMAGPAGTFIKWLTDTMKSLTSFIGEIHNTNGPLQALGLIIGNVIITAFSNLAKIFFAFNTVLLQVLSTLPLIGSKFLPLIAASQSMNASISQQTQLWRDVLSVQLDGEKKKTDALKNTAKVGMDVSTAMNAWIQDENLKTRDKFLADVDEDLKAYQAFANSFITTQVEMWNFATSMSNTFFSGFGDGFAKMVMEGKNFSESMKALFRNMAEQMISYVVQVIAKMLVLFALEQATGIGGLGGTAVSAFGAFATGGMIMEPSVLVGLQSGSKTLVGESGPELVSPMSGGTQGAGSADNGNKPSGNITINISGQFLEADQATWRQLVNSQIIPAIRRFTQSSSTGPFNRTRGVV